MEYSIPYAGYVLAGIADPRVRFLLVGIPALLIGIVAARQLWRDDAVPGATGA